MSEAGMQPEVGRADVFNAYRCILGRNPESEAVIEENLRRPVAETVEAFLGSGEFDTLLIALAEGALPNHAALAPEDVREARAWGEERLAMPDLQDGPQGTGCSPVAALVFGLLRLELAEGALARLDRRRRRLIERMAMAPERSLLSRLTMPPGAEDRALLAALLGGAEPGEGAPPGSLLALLREALEAPGFREGYLAPLRAGEAPALPAPEPARLAAFRDWLGARFGLAAEGESREAIFAALLALPVLRGPLLGLEAGEAEALAQRLRDLRPAPEPAPEPEPEPFDAVTAEDAAFAWRLVLGREADGEAVIAPHLGSPLPEMLRILLISDEFRLQVLEPLAQRGASAQHGFALPVLERLGAWVAARLGLPPAPEERLTAPGLLLRLFGRAPFEAVLRSAHGPLFDDALPALAAWHRRAARGLIGAIDYVTGESIVGWAMDRYAPERPLEIELRCNGALIGLARADRPRIEPGEAPGPACGFRLAWRGREREAPPGGQVFRVHLAADGEPIGPPFRLDTVFAEPRDTLRFLAAELDRTQQMLRRIEAMLPQVESFAAFPAADWNGFRHRHRTPAPALPRGHESAFAILVEAEEVPPAQLRRVLASLARQSHRHFQALCLAKGAEQRAVIAQAADRDERFALVKAGVKGLRRAAARGLPGAAAAVLEAAQGEAFGRAPLVLLLPAGTVLDPEALAWFAHAAASHPACAGFFADAETILPEGLWEDRHLAPQLRSAYDRHLMAVENVCGGLICARREALAEALAAPFEDIDTPAQTWLTWARLAALGPLGHVPRLLSAGLEAPPAAPEAPPPALAAALAGQGGALPEAARLAVIVPTRNGGAMLRDCVTLLAERAARPERLEIIVLDNGSDQEETLAFLAAAQAEGKLVCRRVDKVFNWAQLNNEAVHQTGAEALLFLNDDTRILTEGWDERLLALLDDRAVGAVGARLVYEDFTIQHAGVLFGREGLVGHEGVGAPMDEPGPGGRWQRRRAAGAVTGAFLACRRADFEQVGGFDAQRFGVTFNDVDFCLKLRAAGLEIVYAPEISLVHFESKTRGIDHFDLRKKERAEFEARLLKERWGEALLVDPCWNPAWSRWTTPFDALREPSAREIEAYIATVSRPAPWRPLDRAAIEALF